MKENKQKIGLTEIARLKQVVHDLQTDEHVCDNYHKKAAARARTAEHELNNANINERACCDDHATAFDKLRDAEQILDDVQTNTDKRFNELLQAYLGCASRAYPRGFARFGYVDIPMGVFDAFSKIYSYIEEE